MKKILLMGFAAAIMLAGCSRDEIVDMPQSKAIGFSNAFVDNATRSVVDPSFTKENLGNFAVYGFTLNGQIFDGVTVTSDDNGSTWTYSPIQYWVEGNEYAFGAIAPASTTVSGESLLGNGINNYKVGMTVSFTNDGKTDLLHAAPAAIDANATFMATPTPVSMTFKHQLSKVKFSFENSISGAYNIKVTDVKITDAKSTGTLTVDAEDENTWANIGGEPLTLEFGNVVASDAGSETGNEAAFIPYNAEGETFNELLMIPTEATESYTVNFTVQLFSGEVEMASYEHTATISGVQLKLGYCYDFKATLTAENIVVDPEDPDAELKPIVFEVEDIEEWNETEEDQNLELPTA